MTIAAYPPARLLPSPLGPRRAWRDRRIRIGPGLPLTLRMHTPPDAFDPQESLSGLRRADREPRSNGDDAAWPALHTGHHPSVAVVSIAYSSSPSRSDNAITAMPSSPSIAVAQLLLLTWAFLLVFPIHHES
jgi:hypothetical protein